MLNLTQRENAYRVFREAQITFLLECGWTQVGVGAFYPPEPRGGIHPSEHNAASIVEAVQAEREQLLEDRFG
jgi:hypothetical protein